MRSITEWLTILMTAHGFAQPALPQSSLITRNPNSVMRTPLLVLKFHLPAGTVPLQCHAYMNARSIVNKTSDLLALLDSRSLDLIAITETFIGPDIPSSEIFPPEYHVFRKDCSRHGGGVLLAVCSFISTVHRADLESNCIPELLWADLSLPSGKLLVGVYYQPPGGHCDELLHLHHALVSMPPSTTYLICGDFNGPGINWSLNFPKSSSTIA